MHSNAFCSEAELGAQRERTFPRREDFRDSNANREKNTMKFFFQSTEDFSDRLKTFPIASNCQKFQRNVVKMLSKHDVLSTQVTYRSIESECEGLKRRYLI